MFELMVVLGLTAASLAPVAVALHRYLEGRWFWQAPIMPGERRAFHDGPTVDVVRRDKHDGELTVRLPDGSTHVLPESVVRAGSKAVRPSASDLLGGGE